MFLERGEWREEERERSIVLWRNTDRLVASHRPQTEDLAHGPGVCPDWEFSQRPFGLHVDSQRTEPHQPGQKMLHMLSEYYLFIILDG